MRPRLAIHLPGLLLAFAVGACDTHATLPEPCLDPASARGERTLWRPSDLDRMSRLLYANASATPQMGGPPLPEAQLADSIAAAIAVRFPGDGGAEVLARALGYWNDPDLRALFTDLDPLAHLAANATGGFDEGVLTVLRDDADVRALLGTVRYGLPPAGAGAPAQLVPNGDGTSDLVVNQGLRGEPFLTQVSLPHELAHLGDAAVGRYEEQMLNTFSMIALLDNRRARPADGQVDTWQTDLWNTLALGLLNAKATGDDPLNPLATDGLNNFPGASTSFDSFAGLWGSLPNTETPGNAFLTAMIEGLAARAGVPPPATVAFDAGTRDWAFATAFPLLYTPAEQAAIAAGFDAVPVGAVGTEPGPVGCAR